MIPGFIVFMAIGILCIAIGIALWSRQKISLVHDYHHTHVKKEDIPAYTRLMGIGMISMGAGSCFTGIIMIAFKTNAGLIAFAAGLIAFAAGFIVGMILIVIAQKKYNGGIF